MSFLWGNRWRLHVLMGVLVPAAVGSSRPILPPRASELHATRGPAGHLTNNACCTTFWGAACFSPSMQYALPLEYGRRTAVSTPIYPTLNTPDLEAQCKATLPHRALPFL